MIGDRALTDPKRSRKKHLACVRETERVDAVHKAIGRVAMVALTLLLCPALTERSDAQQSNSASKEPIFSSGGITVKLISISKNKNSQIAVSMLIQNNNSFNILATLLGVHSLVDNNGNKYNASFFDGVATCGIIRPTEFAIRECVYNKNSEMAQTQIDAGSSALANAVFSCPGMRCVAGSLFSYTGAMSYVPFKEPGPLTPGSKGQPKVLTIPIPLMPLAN